MGRYAAQTRDLAVPWQRSRATQTCCIGLCLSTVVLGCSVRTPGVGHAPPNTVVEKSVEWVTDPESGSSSPEFLSVTLRGDGTFIAGDDFPTGTYISPGGRQGTLCTWRQLSVAPDGTQKVRKSGSGNAQQEVVVELRGSRFESESCMPWARSRP